MRTLILLTLILVLPFALFAQEQVTFKGLVTDDNNIPLFGANVVLSNSSTGAVTNENGRFEFRAEATSLSDPIQLIVSYVGYLSDTLTYEGLSEIPDKIRVKLSNSLQIGQVDIISNEDRIKVSTISLDPKTLEFAPTVSGSIESLIQLGPGVSTRSELSNQYSVRGGNYDENLVYVNDFEIYRPFLMRNGQQEGLSFINPDLVRDIDFASGGFAAEYGDKMSSVLDIKYKRPDEFKGSFTASLRGVSAHVEGSSKSNRVRFLTGVRYKNTAAILKSLDTKGQYNPNAFDIQTNLIFILNEHWEMEALFNYSSTNFNLVPSEQQTTTGAINQAIRFSVFFEGNEKDKFRNTMGGLALNYQTDRLQLKFLTSAFRMNESENFNIIGQYRLDEVETDFSSDDFGDVKATLGVGTFHDWGRNELEAVVANYGHKGSFGYKRHILQWGTTFQQEIIEDELSEWERLDSAGYSLPYNGYEVNVFSSLKTSASLRNWRNHGYVQNTLHFGDSESTRISLNTGLRYHFWSYNKQFIASPRAQLAIEPPLKNDSSSLVFKFAGGLYEQMPFYREIRNLEGELSNDVKAQRSIHAVFGIDYRFITWKDRNFRLTAEAYYKKLDRVNPYQLDDIRIRYYGENSANGYAYGLDLRMFGELVKGTDSWMSFSFLQVKEDLVDDFQVRFLNAGGEVVTPFSEDQVVVDTVSIAPGSIPKPTEQVFNFGLYFSDYMTKNENFKMHIAMQFGTGLPYGPPDGNRYTDVLRAPGYKRVDIGFSALLLDGKKERNNRRSGKGASHFDKIWVSAEVFNLLGNRNVVSYRWIKDTQNILWPLPNYLTSRRFNIKLHIKFS